MATNKKNAHLLGFVQHGVNSHATGMWRHPQDKVGWDWTRPPYWQHMARTMERGMFDAMFIADELAPYNNYRGSSDDTVRFAVQCPVHEPSTIVPINYRSDNYASCTTSPQNWNISFGFKSNHTGGANFLLGDGSKVGPDGSGRMFR